MIRWLALPVLMLLATAPLAESTAHVRPAAVAGSWYPDDPEQLAAHVDALLQEAGPSEANSRPVLALISPHAGYRYSGAIAAAGFRQLQGQSFERVVVLGPAHRGGFHGLSIADVTHYRTPLGRIPLDRDAVAALRNSPLVHADPLAHGREHSIESQLPLLQRTLQPGWQLVPVLVGQLRPADYADTVKLLRPLLQGNTLVIVSSDFTHYGARFDYQPFPLDDETEARLDALDHGSLEYILDKDPQGFLEYKARTGSTICGYRPIALLLHLLPPGSKGALAAYATSGELSGDFSHSVSYMSILFHAPGSPALAGDSTSDDPLAEADMRLLHRLASSAVTLATNPGDRAAETRLQHLLDTIPDRLRKPAGAFVTLKRNGRLRGCVGYVRPRKPLFRAVMENGINAALRDWRFPPLQAEELEGLELEISVLTPAREIGSPEDIIVGEHGVILEKDEHIAVYLPKVASDMGWTREQMLDSLAKKAELPEDVWQQDAVLSTFRARNFKAPHRGD